jgi:hypothetical protein
VGFLIAPLVPWLVLEISGVLNTGRPPEIFFGVFLILPISYLTSLVLGAPVVYALRRLRLIRLWYYALAGFLAAGVPIFALLVYPFLISIGPSSQSASLLPVHYRIAAMMALSGVLVATAFWVITRPDKTTVAD